MTAQEPIYLIACGFSRARPCPLARPTLSHHREFEKLSKLGKAA